MDKTLEREFFKPFEIGKEVHSCIEFVRGKNNTDISKRHACQDRALEIIIQRKMLEEYDWHLDGNSPLLDEIQANLE